MFLKRMNDVTGTLAFRLTAWYAVIFTVCSLIALSVFYYKISVITLKASDQELLEEVDEFAVIVKEGGADHVKKYMTAEVESDEEDVFFRLVSPDGRILEMKGKPFWNQIKPPSHIFETLQKTGKPVLETLTLQGYKYPVRTVCGMISPELMLQVGISLAENEKYLHVFRRLLLNLIFPLFFISTVIGWFLARHALKGVEEVTLTAMDITKGAYDKRVQVKKRLLEVSRLAETFNTMLDKIQALLKNMREITDNIAHDLRSPLARIRGIAEVILVGKSSISDYEEMAASTIEECDNLIDMINIMLDIMETEAGVGRFEKEPVDLKKLLIDACDLFRPVADEKNITLLMRLADEMVIQGDKSRLQRMVTNLLENAIKYTGPGGKVTISAYKDNRQVHIVFEDTGIGIPAAEIPQIFERFYRCDRSRAESGVGLGLSLAKAIAKSFGGDISVESVPGQGSTFHVTLFRGKSPADTVEPIGHN
ncbi:MAG: two-component sensor histidine kinase [Desulfobacterales bacterium CG23_combo_of_CG06-09_8_20_14_all_51_8]|nr:MAG: two-component sensor histidine kinase [Desulfobacterales bacterium CG23_combo_of_CG06-09_8_20_14_all_51_8]